MNENEKYIKEYELCQDTTQKIESTIWKTSTAMGIGSIGPLILFMTRSIKPDWQSVTIVGLLIFFSSIIWWFMARRWWDIQHVTFLRMKHLEEKLGFYQTRYIYYKDGKLEDIKPNDLTTDQLEQLKGDFKSKGNIQFPLRGVQKWLKLFPWFILISWFGYGFHIWYSSGNENKIGIFKYPIVYIGFILAAFIVLLFINPIITRRRNKEELEEVKSRA